MEGIRRALTFLWLPLSKLYIYIIICCYYIIIGSGWKFPVALEEGMPQKYGQGQGGGGGQCTMLVIFFVCFSDRM